MGQPSATAPSATARRRNRAAAPGPHSPNLIRFGVNKIAVLEYRAMPGNNGRSRSTLTRSNRITLLDGFRKVFPAALSYDDRFDISGDTLVTLIRQ